MSPKLRAPKHGATAALSRSLSALMLVMTSLVASHSPTLTALPDDRRKAIEITAARALRDEKAGFTVYSGDVVLQQGSLYIEADKLTIFHDSDDADRIVAIGSPARLRQQPAIDKGFVTALAGRIVYEKSTERVMLRTDASISQDGAVVSGESIDYFMAEQRVLADASATDESARVQVLIPAEAMEEQNTDEVKSNKDADGKTWQEDGDATNTTGGAGNIDTAPETPLPSKSGTQDAN